MASATYQPSKEPRTAGPSWHCHPCAFRHLVPQKGALGHSQRHPASWHPQSPKPRDCSGHLCPRPGIPATPSPACPTFGAGKVGDTSRWEAVARSQSRCLGPALAEISRWDGLVQPAQHLPLVIQSEHRGLAGGWHFQLTANTPPVWLRGKLRQGQEVSAGILTVHPCSLLGARHRAVGEDLGAATTTRGPWGTVGTGRDPLTAGAWPPEQLARLPAAAVPC